MFVIINTLRGYPGLTYFKQVQTLYNPWAFCELILALYCNGILFFAKISFKHLLMHCGDKMKKAYYNVIIFIYIYLNLPFIDISKHSITIQPFYSLFHNVVNRWCCSLHI